MNDRPDRQLEKSGAGDSRVSGPHAGVHANDETLSALLDRALPSSERLAAQAHLDTCADCRSRFGELRAMQAMFRALPTPVARRSFQLGPEHLAARSSIWSRLAALLLPTLPALRAATVAVALLLAAVSIRNALEDPASRGPVSDAPLVAQTVQSTAQTIGDDGKNTAELPANQQAATLAPTQQLPQPESGGNAESLPFEESAADGTGIAAPAQADESQRSGMSDAESSESEPASDGSSNVVTTDEPAADAALEAPADLDTDAMTDAQAGADSAAEESIPIETDEGVGDDFAGAAAEAPSGESETSLAMLAESAPAASPAPATPEPTATAIPTPTETATPVTPTPSPTADAVPPTATAEAGGWDGWRVAQVVLACALVVLLATLGFVALRLRRTSI